MQNSYLWYEIKDGYRVLLINLDHADPRLLTSLGEVVSSVGYDGSEHSLEHIQGLSERSYDLILAFGIIEISEHPEYILGLLKNRLKPDGRLLIGTDNRLGIRYFCGERDPYTGGLFNGLEDYFFSPVYGKEFKGRAYSHSELESMLSGAGLTRTRFYSVFPSIDRVQLIFSEDYLPNEKLNIRYFPGYTDTNSILINENYVCDSLAQNGLLHKMANSYLIECSLNGGLSETKCVTVSSDRGQSNSMITIIDGNSVVKRPLNDEGWSALKRLSANMDYLKQHRVGCVEGHLTDNGYVMPYVNCISAYEHLQKLFYVDADLLIEHMDKFHDLIMSSSPVIDNSDEYGPILERGFVDLVPINCFWDGNEYVVYDQEYYKEGCPAGLMMLRTIIMLYDDTNKDAVLPQSFFMDRYGLSDHYESLRRLEREFINELHSNVGVDEIKDRYKTIGPAEILSNRSEYEMYLKKKEGRFDDFRSNKIYSIGYISGVFDLFHIGHVNILRRAKERCDHLIVGVTDDEYVREKKHCDPFIPFEERYEVLRACRYVDEVVEVPYKYCGVVEAFEKYHFDVQFCGSDYANDSWWLDQKKWLEDHGSTIVFLPYTETTCSTKIRDAINMSVNG